jgi:hypothetical protein
MVAEFCTDFMCMRVIEAAPNGERYPRVGGTRQRRFAGTNFKPRKLPENAQTPTRRVHAVLAATLCLKCNLDMNAVRVPLSGACLAK